jgi:hypothetical protein
LYFAVFGEESELVGALGAHEGDGVERWSGESKFRDEFDSIWPNVADAALVAGHEDECAIGGKGGQRAEHFATNYFDVGFQLFSPVKRNAFVQDRGHAEGKIGSGRDQRSNRGFSLPGGGWDAVAVEREAMVNPEPKVIALSCHLPKSNGTRACRERFLQSGAVQQLPIQGAIFEHSGFGQTQ